MLQGSRLGQYEIQGKIGQGAFGQIFKVRSSDGQTFCAKIESSFTRHKSLGIESKILNKLKGSPYFPNRVTSGRSQYFNYIIMEYVGPSLQTKLKKVNWSPSLSTLIGISAEILRAIRELHQRGFIHRDIKPGNIVLRKDRVCLIDFGLSRAFHDSRTGEHRSPRKQPGFRGTAVYASVNAHLNEELSRRDDLISWFYVVSELLLGRLPWHNMSSDEIIGMKKMFDTDPPLCQTYSEFRNIWNHIVKLEYADEPDYELCLAELDELRLRLGLREPDAFDSDGANVSDDTAPSGERASCKMTTPSNSAEPSVQRNIKRATAGACCNVA